MKNYCVYLFLLVTICIGSCKDNTDSKRLQKSKTVQQNIPVGWQQSRCEDFTIIHPQNWRKDTSGLMGTKLLLFAPTDEHDHNSFAVNINTIIQELPSPDLTLEQFIEASLEQIDNYITNAKILSNKKIMLNNKNFYELIYTGKQGNADLQFHQYCHVGNGKAYIVTLTTLKKAYETYKDVGTKIMKTFQPS